MDRTLLITRGGKRFWSPSKIIKGIKHHYYDQKQGAKLTFVDCFVLYMLFFVHQPNGLWIFKFYQPQNRLGLPLFFLLVSEAHSSIWSAFGWWLVFILSSWSDFTWRDLTIKCILQQHYFAVVCSLQNIMGLIINHNLSAHCIQITSKIDTNCLCPVM